MSAQPQPYTSSVYEKTPAVIANPTAWESVPKFIRFTTWVVAISTIASIAIGVLFFLLGMAGLAALFSV